MAEPDRRVRRTRKLLHEAFIALVLDKGYEQMTVQDILDRADVGRSTFYVHFRDKEALLTATFDGMREQLTGEFERMAAAGLPVEVDRPAALIFAHAYRNQRVYRALCGKRGGTVVIGHLHEVIVELLRESLPPQPRVLPDAVISNEVVAEFYAAAAIGLLGWWIDHDFHHDPVRLAADFRQLATRGIGIAPTR